MSSSNLQQSLSALTEKRKMGSLPKRRQLRALSGFYIDLELKERKLGEVISIGGRNYYRYMDRIFSPVPIRRMNAKQSMLMCEIRLRYFKELVNDEYNLQVISAFIKQSEPFEKGLKILDFGCGSGDYTAILKQRIAESDVYGIDISMKSIQFARRKYLDVNWLVINEEQKFPFADSFFDTIYSSFVMHFNISLFFLQELFRVLKPTGQFIFNIYNPKYFSRELFSALIKTGFIIEEVKPDFQTEQRFYKLIKG